MRMKYIIFDLEATCWDNDRSKISEIIEIGAVKIDEQLKNIDTFQSFIQPALNTQLSSFCTNLTTIAQEDVDNARKFKEVIENFKSWIGEEYILCSWGEYDKKQLIKDLKLHGLDSLWVNKHISLKHQYMKQQNINGKQAGMASVLRSLGINLIGTHHRGIDDALNISQIFKRNFENWVF